MSENASWGPSKTWRWGEYDRYELSYYGKGRRLRNRWGLLDCWLGVERSYAVDRDVACLAVLQERPGPGVNARPMETLDQIGLTTQLADGRKVVGSVAKRVILVAVADKACMAHYRWFTRDDARLMIPALQAFIEGEEALERAVGKS